MIISTRSHALFERLESRRLFSASLGIDDALQLSGPMEIIDEMQHIVPLSCSPIRRTTNPLPNVRRTYTGTYSDDVGVVASFTVRIRKQQVRDGGAYAALRGTIDIVADESGKLHGEMTYGKIRASNLRVNLTFTSTSPVFTLNVTAKASTTGSQIKGTFATSGAFTVSGPFLVRKYVAP